MEKLIKELQNTKINDTEKIQKILKKINNLKG